MLTWLITGAACVIASVYVGFAIWSLRQEQGRQLRHIHSAVMPWVAGSDMDHVIVVHRHRRGAWAYGREKTGECLFGRHVKVLFPPELTDREDIDAPWLVSSRRRRHYKAFSSLIVPESATLLPTGLTQNDTAYLLDKDRVVVHARILS